LLWKILHLRLTSKQEYNKTQTDKRNDYRRRVREDKTVPGADTSEITAVTSANGAANGTSLRDSKPAAKKARIADGVAAEGYESVANDNDDDDDGDTIDENEEDENENEQSDGDDVDDELDETELEPEGDVEDPIEVDDGRHHLDDDDEEEDGSESD